MRRHVCLVLAVGLSVLLAGGSHAAAQRRVLPAGAGTSASPPTVTKLLVFVEENHSLAQMRAGMPYTFALAERYGYATDYHALTHPSLPNYLAITGGGMYGVQDDRDPAAHPLAGRSVFGQARHHGKTARTYAESMPARCTTHDSGRYAVRHNPWTYFAREHAGCVKSDRRLLALAPDVAAGRLPRVGMVIPNTCHDAHDCSLGTADRWLKRQMTAVFAGPDWASGHLVVVVTADEDDKDHGNVVLTTVIHPSQNHRVVSTALSHYSLTRLYDEVAGLPLLHRAASAPSMATAFHLPVD